MHKQFMILLLLSAAFHPRELLAQSDPEFPRGFIMYLNMHNGASTSFSRRPDLYAGGAQLVPEVTVVPGVLRVGAVAGAVYTDKKISGLFGPTASVKLFNIPVLFLGSAGNIHLTVDHLWGTGRQRLAGGGLYADILNKALIGITTHRDYHLNTWWFQQALGFRISRKQITTPPFNQ